MADLEALKALADIMNEGPMRTFLVKADEVESESKRLAEETGLRLASVSNAGLPKEWLRLTFLPQDAFNEPDPDFKPTRTVSAKGQETMRYICVQGHDLCSTSYPGPECPYCEARPLKPGEDII